MKYAIVLVSCIALAACGGTESITVETAPVKVQIAQPPPPEPIHPLPVTFKVVNKSNQTDQLNALYSQDEAFIALSTKDYENMSLNMADITRYLKQQQGIIDYYKKMTDVSASDKPDPEKK